MYYFKEDFDLAKFTKEVEQLGFDNLAIIKFVTCGRS